MKSRILKTIVPLICLVLTAVVFAQEKTGPHFEAVEGCQKGATFTITQL